ncbi:type IV secretion system protein [Salmonella enterica]|uniref:type IV secretion system protein n=1 Tax=Salmonella enterica TaxID=28901 RepID=UPI003BEBFD57
MKMSKAKQAIAGAILFSVVSTSQAYVGIPVVDVGSITNQITQINHMLSQLNEMKQQVSLAERQIDSLTGSRGMGGLLGNQNRNYLPSNWNEAMNLLNGSSSGYSNLANAVNTIKDAQSVLSKADLDNLSPEMQKYLEQARNLSAAQQAIGQEAYSNASKRIDLLQQLTNQINTATDPKAIYDLQARIQSEQTQLQNDQSKLQSVAQLQDAQQIASSQMKNEMRAQTSGNGNFPRIDTSLSR